MDRFLCLVLVLLGHARVESVLKNVALMKPTTHRDLYTNWYSSRAVNGELEQSSTDYSACSNTLSGDHTWWVVDLIHHYDISGVRIQNREVFTYRLQDFYIYVTSFNPVPMLVNFNPEVGDLCLHHPGILPHDGLNLQELRCDSGRSVNGRYVYVWKVSHSHLSLCEFEVWVDVDGDRRTVVGKNVYPGKTIPLTPMYTEVQTRISPDTCCLTCMSKPDSDASHFQVNRQSGECGCYQWSDLDNQDLVLTPDVDQDVWDMYIASD